MLPTFTLDKCIVFTKASKNELQSTGHLHSWTYILGKTKMGRTQARQSLPPLCLKDPRLGYNINVSGGKKWIEMRYLGRVEYYSARKIMKYCHL